VGFYDIWRVGRLWTTHTQPFFGSVDFVRDNPGEPRRVDYIMKRYSGHQSVVSIPLHCDCWASRIERGYCERVRLYWCLLQSSTHAPSARRQRHCAHFSAECVMVEIICSDKCPLVCYFPSVHWLAFYCFGTGHSLSSVHVFVYSLYTG